MRPVWATSIKFLRPYFWFSIEGPSAAFDIYWMPCVCNFLLAAALSSLWSVTDAHRQRKNISRAPSEACAAAGMDAAGRCTGIQDSEWSMRSVSLQSSFSLRHKWESELVSEEEEETRRKNQKKEGMWVWLGSIKLLSKGNRTDRVGKRSISRSRS